MHAAVRATFSWADQFEVYATENLSAGGAALRVTGLDQPLPPADVEGLCAFSLDDVELAMRATVVRQLPEGFALRFVGVPVAVQDRIAGWVFRQEARARPPRSRR